MLDGAKFVCLDENGQPIKTIEAKGRTFTIGYLMDCDHNIGLNDEAEKIHCQIECDAFGHISIYNKSEKNPISVNGETVTIKRTLFNNSKIRILDKEYMWQHKQTVSNVDIVSENSEGMSTPVKQIGIPEQPPSSCPALKYHRDLPKRLTVHNLRTYRVDTDDNVTMDNDESSNQNEVSTAHDETAHADSQLPMPEIDVTPAKVDLVDSTTNKKTSSTEKRLKAFRSSCGWSGMTTTSYSPRETGVRIEKTFTAIIPPTTPRSVYCRTPKGLLETLHLQGERQDGIDIEIISYATPSKKPSGQNGQEILVQHVKSAMKIVDLTTPTKLRAQSPLAHPLSSKKSVATKSFVSFSEKNLSAVDKRTATPSATPKIRLNDTPLSCASVISVDSSVASEVSEVTDANAVSSSTPVRSQLPTASVLRKQALLVSAKKQVTANTASIARSPKTPSNLAVLPRNASTTGTPITNQMVKSNTSTQKTQPAISKSGKPHDNVAVSKKNPVIRRLDISTTRQSINPVNKGSETPSSTAVGTAVQLSTDQNKDKMMIYDSTSLTTSTPYKSQSNTTAQPSAQAELNTGTELSLLQSSNEEDNYPDLVSKEVEESCLQSIVNEEPARESVSENDDLLKEIEEILSTSDELRKQLRTTATLPAEEKELNEEDILNTEPSPTTSKSPESTEVETNTNVTPTKNSLSASILLKAINSVDKNKPKPQKEDEEKENKVNECASTPARRRISLSTAAPSIATTPAVVEEISIVTGTPLTPKRVTKRRPSISLENEDVPAAHISQRIIDTYNTENMGAIIEEEADVVPEQTEQPLSSSDDITKTPRKSSEDSNLDETTIPETPMCPHKPRIENVPLNEQPVDDASMSPLHCADESFAEEVIIEEQGEIEECLKAQEVPIKFVEKQLETHSNDETNEGDITHDESFAVIEHVPLENTENVSYITNQKPESVKEQHETTPEIAEKAVDEQSETVDENFGQIDIFAGKESSDNITGKEHAVLSNADIIEIVDSSFDVSLKGNVAQTSEMLSATSAEVMVKVEREEKKQTEMDNSEILDASVEISLIEDQLEPAPQEFLEEQTEQLVGKQSPHSFELEIAVGDINIEADQKSVEEQAFQTSRLNETFEIKPNQSIIDSEVLVLNASCQIDAFENEQQPLVGDNDKSRIEADTTTEKPVFEQMTEKGETVDLETSHEILFEGEQLELDDELESFDQNPKTEKQNTIEESTKNASNCEKSIISDKEESIEVNKTQYSKEILSQVEARVEQSIEKHGIPIESNIDVRSPDNTAEPQQREEALQVQEDVEELEAADAEHSILLSDEELSDQKELTETINLATVETSDEELHDDKKLNKESTETTEVTTNSTIEERNLDPKENNVAEESSIDLRSSEVTEKINNLAEDRAKNTIEELSIDLGSAEVTEKITYLPEEQTRNTAEESINLESAEVTEEYANLAVKECCVESQEKNEAEVSPIYKGTDIDEFEDTELRDIEEQLAMDDSIEDVYEKAQIQLDEATNELNDIEVTLMLNETTNLIAENVCTSDLPSQKSVPAEEIHQSIQDKSDVVADNETIQSAIEKVETNAKETEDSSQISHNATMLNASKQQEVSVNIVQNTEAQVLLVKDNNEKVCDAKKLAVTHVVSEKSSTISAPNELGLNISTQKDQVMPAGVSILAESPIDFDSVLECSNKQDSPTDKSQTIKEISLMNEIVTKLELPPTSSEVLAEIVSEATCKVDEIKFLSATVEPMDDKEVESSKIASTSDQTNNVGLSTVTDNDTEQQKRTDDSMNAEEIRLLSETIELSDDEQQQSPKVASTLVEECQDQQLVTANNIAVEESAKVEEKELLTETIDLSLDDDDDELSNQLQLSREKTNDKTLEIHEDVEKRTDSTQEMMEKEEEAENEEKQTTSDLLSSKVAEENELSSMGAVNDDAVSSNQKDVVEAIMDESSSEAKEEILEADSVMLESAQNEKVDEVVQPEEETVEGFENLAEILLEKQVEQQIDRNVEATAVKADEDESKQPDKQNETEHLSGIAIDELNIAEAEEKETGETAENLPKTNENRTSDNGLEANGNNSTAETPVFPESAIESAFEKIHLNKVNEEVQETIGKIAENTVETTTLKELEVADVQLICHEVSRKSSIGDKDDVLSTAALNVEENKGDVSAVAAPEMEICDVAENEPSQKAEDKEDKLVVNKSHKENNLAQPPSMEIHVIEDSNDELQPENAEIVKEMDQETTMDTTQPENAEIVKELNQETTMDTTQVLADAEKESNEVEEVKLMQADVLDETKLPSVEIASKESSAAAIEVGPITVQKSQEDLAALSAEKSLANKQVTSPVENIVDLSAEKEQQEDNVEETIEQEIDFVVEPHTEMTKSSSKTDEPALKPGQAESQQLEDKNQEIVPQTTEEVQDDSKEALHETASEKYTALQEIENGVPSAEDILEVKGSQVDEPKVIEEIPETAVFDHEPCSEAIQDTRQEDSKKPVDTNEKDEVQATHIPVQPIDEAKGKKSRTPIPKAEEKKSRRGRQPRGTTPKIDHLKNSEKEKQPEEKAGQSEFSENEDDVRKVLHSIEETQEIKENEEMKTEAVVETVVEAGQPDEMQISTTNEVKEKKTRRGRQARAVTSKIAAEKPMEAEKEQPTKTETFEETTAEKRTEKIEETKDDVSNETIETNAAEEAEVNENEQQTTVTEVREKKTRRGRQARAVSVTIGEEEQKISNKSKEPVNETTDKDDEKQISEEVSETIQPIDDTAETKKPAGKQKSTKERKPRRGKQAQAEATKVESIEQDETIGEIKQESYKEEVVADVEQFKPIPESVEATKPAEVLTETKPVEKEAQNTVDEDVLVKAETTLDVSSHRSLRRRAAVQSYQILSDSEDEAHHTSSRKRRAPKNSQKQARTASFVDDTDTTAANTSKAKAQRVSRKKAKTEPKSEHEEAAEEHIEPSGKVGAGKQIEPKANSTLIGEVLPDMGATHEKSSTSKEHISEVEEVSENVPTGKQGKGRKATTARSRRGATKTATHHDETAEHTADGEKSEAEPVKRPASRRGGSKKATKTTEETDQLDLEEDKPTNPAKRTTARRGKAAKPEELCDEIEASMCNESHITHTSTPHKTSQKSRGKKEVAETIAEEEFVAEEDAKTQPKNQSRRKGKSTKAETTEQENETTSTAETVEVPPKRRRRQSVQSEQHEEAHESTSSSTAKKPRGRRGKQVKEPETAPHEIEKASETVVEQMEEEVVKKPARGGRRGKRAESTETVVPEKRRKQAKTTTTHEPDEDEDEKLEDLAIGEDVLQPESTAANKTARGRRGKQIEPTDVTATVQSRRNIPKTQKVEKTDSIVGDVEHEDDTQLDETSAKKTRVRRKKPVELSDAIDTPKTVRGQRRKHVHFDEEPSKNADDVHAEAVESVAAAVAVVEEVSSEAPKRRRRR